MHNRAFKKLLRTAPLTADDQRRLADISNRCVEVEADHDVVTPGEVSQHLHLLVDGFACRYDVRKNGQRSIMAVLVPGDFCDLQALVLGKIDHAVATLTPCRIASVSRDEIDEVMAEDRILKAFWRATLVDEAIQRQWIVSIGRRSAEERLAHLLCELYIRLSRIDLVDEDVFPFPFTQAMVGDMLAISTVHANRVSRTLAERGIARIRGKSVRILDLARLVELAEFESAYLETPRISASPGRVTDSIRLVSTG